LSLMVAGCGGKEEAKKAEEAKKVVAAPVAAPAPAPVAAPAPAPAAEEAPASAPACAFQTYYCWQRVMKTEKCKVTVCKKVPCKVKCRKPEWTTEKKEVTCYEPQRVKKMVKCCCWTWQRQCVYRCCAMRARWVQVPCVKEVEVECWECVPVKKMVDVQVLNWKEVEVDGFQWKPVEEEREYQVVCWERKEVKVPCRTVCRPCYTVCRPCFRWCSCWVAPACR
ncbi:MAG: hypothetical protein Q4D98_00775, partial [Planctomycetia bacterium]|nr:hypothetical protein [Planctomycetia bacterium]